MVIYLDTETSGLYPGQICELSYIMQDREKTVAKNMFFSVDFVEYGALSVHGFSVEKLKTLSEGKKFYDRIDEIEKDFSGADVICAHNTAFDFSFLRAEFERCGKVFTCKNEFCTMKKMTSTCKLPRNGGMGYKYPKLSELCAFLHITDTEIKQTVKLLYGMELDYHDARFDTVAVYLAVNSGFNYPALSILKDYL